MKRWTIRRWNAVIAENPDAKEIDLESTISKSIAVDDRCVCISKK